MVHQEQLNNKEITVYQESQENKGQWDLQDYQEQKETEEAG